MYFFISSVPPCLSLDVDPGCEQLCANGGRRSQPPDVQAAQSETVSNPHIVQPSYGCEGEGKPLFFQHFHHVVAEPAARIGENRQHLADMTLQIIERPNYLRPRFLQ